MTPIAIACRFSSATDHRDFYREDRDEQRELVRTLTREADEVFVAKALSDSHNRETLDLEVLESLKGTVVAPATITYLMEREFIIGCGAAAGFRNVTAFIGQTYIVYVRSGIITRAGNFEREYPEISFREERRLVRRTLRL